MEKIKLLVLLLILTGCTEIEQTQKADPVAATDGAFKLASFNIQTYGQAKSSNQEVLEILTIVACEFDVMAIQEIRDASGESLQIYLDNINAVCENGERAYIMSEPLGRSTSKERYAFIYNKDTVKSNGYIVYADPLDVFEREPMVASFTIGNLSFTAINVHVKPTDAENEIAALKTVLDSVVSKNFVLLGDLNADCSYYDETSTTLRNYNWIVEDSADTTTGDTQCTYDRIIASDGMYQYFTGEWNIFRFDEILDLTQDQAKTVSDHYPVWAEFNTH